MGAAILRERARRQPQQTPQLDRSNKFAARAQAMVTATSAANLASGVLLTTAGSGVAKVATVAGIADAFRKNFYRATELLPAIGTQSFVEFWVGYPNANTGNQSNANDAGFLTGSSNNSTGIAGFMGQRRPSGSASNWGTVYNWTNLNSAGETLIPGVLTVLVVIRRQDRMDLWRDGVLVASFAQAPVSYAASKFLVGSFIESATWMASSDMLLAGRTLTPTEPTDDEVRSFCANPWQVFLAPARLIVNSIDAPGGTPTNVDVQVGQLAIAGYAPQVSQAVNLTPAAAALAITGYAPTISQATAISPSTGELAITGYAPTVTQGSSIDVLPGALPVSGYAPIVSHARTVDVPAAQLDITGYPPTVAHAQAAPRYARPAGDLAAGGWSPSAGSSLADMLTETSPDAGTFIQAGAPSTCEIRLGAVQDPNTSSGQVVRYMAGSSTGNGLVVRLKQGTAVIAQWSHASLPAQQTVFTQVLTAAQCDSIMDYGDLRFEFEAG